MFTAPQLWPHLIGWERWPRFPAACCGLSLRCPGCSSTQATTAATIGLVQGARGAMFWARVLLSHTHTHAHTARATDTSVHRHIHTHICTNKNKCNSFHWRITGFSKTMCFGSVAAEPVLCGMNHFSQLLVSIVAVNSAHCLWAKLEIKMPAWRRDN